MLQRTFWTERRLTGLLLILGSIMFLAGAGTSVRDSSGTYIYDLSLKAGLRVIAGQHTLWALSNALFIGGTLLTLVGLSWLSATLRELGNRLLAQAAFLLILVAAVLLSLAMAFHIGVDFPAAQDFVKTGIAPNDYLLMSHWADTLFSVYTVLILLSMMTYGVALLLTRLLPAWLGWLLIGYNLLWLVFFVTSGDLPPFLHQVLPIVLGSLLLLPRYQTSAAGKPSTTASMVASTT